MGAVTMAALLLHIMPETPPHNPLFFADATLDLEEAHDIADTPEVERPVAQSRQPPTELLGLPSLEIGDDDDDENHDNLHRVVSTVLVTPPRHRPTWPRDASWALVWLLLLISMPILWTHPPPLRHFWGTVLGHIGLISGALSLVALRFVYSLDDPRAWTSPTLWAGVLWTLWSVWHVRWIYVGLPLAWTYLYRPVPQSAYTEAVWTAGGDALWRSLRRKTVLRWMTVLLAVQWVNVSVWQALLHQFWNKNQFSYFWLCLMLAYWTTNVIRRMATHLAAGGVTHWLLSLVPESTSRVTAAHDENDEVNAYRSVMLEDVVDDEELDDDEEVVAAGEQTPNPLATVRGLSTSSWTVSLGSVVKCALLGGIGQILWRTSHRIERWNRRQPNTLLYKISVQLNAVLQRFARNHSDLAMGHVAVYFKSYSKAAREVLSQMDMAGVEPILVDEATTVVATRLAAAGAAMWLVVAGWILTHQRRHAAIPLTDEEILERMILVYWNAFSMFLTVLEPLRASIKALFVCFAYHPMSLSHAYPLIYRRLKRISESNASELR